MFAPSSLPRNLEASFRDLASKQARTRASAVRDLVRHALENDETRARAIPEIERALKKDGEASVRAEAALALADLGAREALASLLTAVEDSDGHVRQMALSALGELGDVRAAARLERALRDERPEVRYQAVIAFARIARDDGPAVTEALVRAVADEDAAIRYIAMRLVEEQRDGDEPLRDSRLVSQAERLAEDPDQAISVIAGLYLARLGRPSGRQIVLAVIAEQRQTPELEDEQACVELAGELALHEAIPALERRVWGRRRALRRVFAWGSGDRASCAWHARVALARMDHARARAEIVGDLGSRKRHLREAAVVAVGRARLTEARAALAQMEGTVDGALVREALLRLGVG